MSLRPTGRRKKHADRRDAEDRWLETPLERVSDTLRELTRTTVERELASREALNGRLGGTITFAGALLAVALAFGQKAGPSDHHHLRHEVFVVGLIVTVVVLVGALIVAILGLRPEPRHHTSIGVLKHYGTTGSDDQEIQRDTYLFEVALAEQLGAGNTSRAKHLLWAQRITVLALIITAVVTVIVIW